MGLREDAERAVVLRVIADALTQEAKLLAERVADEMRQLGTDRVTVTDPDLAELGKLTKNPDRMVWGVTDPEAFKEWVTNHRPKELMLSINPAFVKWVLAEAEANNGIVGDPETGNMIPGLGREKRIGTFTVTKSADAKARAAALVQTMIDGGVATLPAIGKE